MCLDDFDWWANCIVGRLSLSLSLAYCTSKRRLRLQLIDKFLFCSTCSVIVHWYDGILCKFKFFCWDFLFRKLTFLLCSWNILFYTCCFQPEAEITSCWFLRKRSSMYANRIILKPGFISLLNQKEKYFKFKKVVKLEHQ